MVDEESDYRYRPINALPYWDTIGEFIDSAVAAAVEATGIDARSLYPATVPFVLWCWRTRGTPLVRERIFRPQPVDEFVHLGMTGYLKGSRATHRAALRIMVEALNPATAHRGGFPIPRSAPTAPYSPSEIAALHSWALTRSTAQRRRDAMILLVLGLGAGLATRELLAVKTGDLDLGAMSVTVSASRPRVVPIATPWQASLVRLAGNLQAPGWAFRPGRQGINPRQVTDFLDRSGARRDIRPSRMRATWLLGHLEAGTAPRELLRISGLRNLAALDRITPTASERWARPSSK